MDSGEQNTTASYFTLRWKEAHQICRKNLKGDDLEQLDKIEDCDAFIQSLTQVQVSLNSMSRPTILNRIRPSLESIKNFLTLMAVSVGSTPLKTAILWGVLSLVIQAVIHMDTILPETLAMIDTLGHDLEILQIYEKSFIDNSQMSGELTEIFVEIITFWTKVVHFLGRNKNEITARRVWPAVQKDFEETSKRIRSRSAQIKEKADALASVRQHSAVLLERLDAYDDGSTIGNSPVQTVSQSSIFPCDNIPFPKNIHFQNRDMELLEVENALSTANSHARFQSFALWGTGGIGKTQIALAYAHSQAEKGVGAVIWINCETGLSVSQSYAEVAKMLHLENFVDGENSDQNRYLTLQWLRKTKESWLIVLDNVDDLDLARSCWPVASHGSILVTSRQSIMSIEPAAGGLEIERFDDASGGVILRGLIGRLDYSKIEIESAIELSIELGGLALAIAVMAAQIKIRRKSIKDFLEFYKAHSEALHAESRGIGNYYKGSLRTCWQATFETLPEEPQQILAVLSFIAPDAIPQSLFRPESPELLPKILQFCADDLKFENALDHLMALSLIRKNSTSKKISIHRLIQHEYRNHLTGEQKQECFNTVSKLLFEVFPRHKDGLSLRNHWTKCKAYIQHVLMLCTQWQRYKFNPTFDEEFQNFITLTTSCGWYLMESGAWSEEVQLMQVAMEVCQDKDGLDYAHLCNSYGCMETERGHAAIAFPYLQQSLNIRKRLLPEDHAELANSYNNFANAVQLSYDSLESTMRCHELLEAARAIDLTKPEKERKTIAYVRNFNLSRSYRLLGDFAKAKIFGKMARDDCVALFGENTHFDATADVHIGNIFLDEGSFEAAKQLFQRAYRIFYKENQLHQATISVSLKIATILMREDADAAIEILKKNLVLCELRERAKGDKGEIARTTRVLATALKLKGNLEEAERLRQSAEEMRKYIQRDRAWQLPDESRSYDIMVFPEFW